MSLSFTNKKLTEVILGDNTEEKKKLLTEIANNIFEHYSSCAGIKNHGCKIERDEAIKETIEYALNSIKRFKPELGRAHAFFTTSMMGFMHQLLWSNRDGSKLFKEHFKGRI